MKKIVAACTTYHRYHYDWAICWGGIFGTLSYCWYYVTICHY